MTTYNPPNCLCCGQPIDMTSDRKYAPWAILEVHAWACWRCYAKYTHSQLVEFGKGGVMQERLFDIYGEENTQA